MLVMPVTLVREQESDTIGNFCSTNKVSTLYRHTQTAHIYNIYAANNTHTIGKPEPATTTGSRTPTNPLGRRGPLFANCIVAPMLQLCRQWFTEIGPPPAVLASPAFHFLNPSYPGSMQT